MKHWRIIAILAVFAIATTAGFMGAFKKKRETWLISGTGRTVLVTNEWNVNALPLTNEYEYEYQVQWNSNLPPLQSLMIGDSHVFTNIVISNDYSGTIQIGTNFATVKELDTWMSVLGSMKRFESAWTTTNVHRSYTVDVANGLWFHTNVIDIHRCSEFCTRMRYVENGLTNDFHAAFTSFTVITNAP